MALYASLGFEVKESLVLMRGKPQSQPPGGIEIRPLGREDLKACAALCQRSHGIERTNELQDALDAPRVCSPFVALRDGRVTGYTYAVFRNLAQEVAETEADMQALISGVSATSAEPLAFRLPIRQASFFRWCWSEGLRIVKPMTPMTVGAYLEPRGVYFPSGLY